jgi:hypothetical protein
MMQISFAPEVDLPDSGHPAPHGVITANIILLDLYLEYRIRFSVLLPTILSAVSSGPALMKLLAGGNPDLSA